MISQKLYPVSFLEYLAILHGCSYQIYTGHFNRYSSIEKNKADTISCGPPLTSKITCFLPKTQVQASPFSLHISYFLQKCKKANPAKWICLFECPLNYFVALGFSLLSFPSLLSLPDLRSGIC